MNENRRPRLTAPREARAARREHAERELNRVLLEVERGLKGFALGGERQWYTTVPVQFAPHVAEAYRQLGWAVVTLRDRGAVLRHAADDVMQHRHPTDPSAEHLLGFTFPPDVDPYHPDAVQPGGAPVLDFWGFVHERQRVWHRRAEGRPRPWTDDPVIRDRFFTNIWRELDPGTELVLPIVGRRGAPAWERLWNLLVYRRFNREETWNHAIGYVDVRECSNPESGFMGPLQAFLRDLYDRLADYRAETGEPLFTDAHQVYPMPMIPGPDLPSRFLRVMLNISRPGREPDSVYSLADKLQAARTKREAYRALVNARIPGVSNFLSWQMTMDLTYGPDPIVTADDDWAPITTGARFGAIMWYHWPKLGTVNYPIEGWPSLPSVPPRDLERFVYRMRDEADERFDERDLNIASVMAPDTRLDMPALEHALCEYSKYVAAAVGLPTRDRFSTTPARGQRRATNRQLEVIASRRGPAKAAIDLDGPAGKYGSDRKKPAAAPAAAPPSPRPARRVAASRDAATGDRDLASYARFRQALADLDARGEAPTAPNIFAELGWSSHNLNSQQAGWRREILTEMGYTIRGGRWARPEGADE